MDGLVGGVVDFERKAFLEPADLSGSGLAVPLFRLAMGRGYRHVWLLVANEGYRPLGRAR